MNTKPTPAALAAAAHAALAGENVWAIHPPALDVVRGVAHGGADVAGLLALSDQLETHGVVREPEARGPRGLTVTRGGVCVISLRGVLTPRGSLLSYLFGGGYGGVNGFRAELAEALADDEVTAILIDVDSPGGVTSTIPETAAEIRAARGVKPIVAIANTLCASAAYWLAAQADEVVITPSGVCGSVGTLIVHDSWAGWNEQNGIEFTYVTAESSPYKAEGNPDEPLDDAARAELQSWVDEVQAMFVADLAAGRGVSAGHVNDRFGKGRVMRPAAAVAAKMCDRVATIDDTIARLTQQGARGRRRGGARAEAGTIGLEFDGETLDEIAVRLAARQNEQLQAQLDAQQAIVDATAQAAAPAPSAETPAITDDRDESLPPTAVYRGDDDESDDDGDPALDETLAADMARLRAQRAFRAA